MKYYLLIASFFILSCENKEAQLKQELEVYDKKIRDFQVQEMAIINQIDQLQPDTILQEDNAKAKSFYSDKLILNKVDSLQREQRSISDSINLYSAYSRSLEKKIMLNK